jgi:GTP-binding protein
VGLGHRFLKHVERSRFLIFVLDMAGTDGRNPLDDLRHLKTELGEHDPELLERPSLIVANKMDMPEAKENLEEFIRETGVTPIQVSVQDRTGLDELSDAVFKMAHPDQDE